MVPNLHEVFDHKLKQFKRTKGVNISLKIRMYSNSYIVDTQSQKQVQNSQL